MKTSIREEFEQRAINYVNNGILRMDNQDDWHYHLFQEDYYIRGYYESEHWLKEHGVSTLEAIQTCVNHELYNFDQCMTMYDDAKMVVNTYVYILSEEWHYQEGEDFITELLDK
jgi:hypothetical protein